MPVDDSVPWVDGYRGLWGLDTRDRFAGERAPAGLKYTRTGAVRPSWNDPIGFLGLDKVAPPTVSSRPSTSAWRSSKWRGAGSMTRSPAAGGLSGRDQAVSAMASDGSMVKLHEVRSLELFRAGSTGRPFRAQRAEFEDERKALVQRRLQAVAGEQGDPRSHLHNDHHPQTTGRSELRADRRDLVGCQRQPGLIALMALLVFTDLPVWAVVLLALGGYSSWRQHSAAS